MLELRLGDVCPSPLQIMHLLSELINDIKMCATGKGDNAFVNVLTAYLRKQKNAGNGLALHC